MWIIKEGGRGCNVKCDHCTEREGTVNLILGATVLAELCVPCAGIYQRHLKRWLKTKPGPPHDSKNEG